jgi:hypothetical protein
MRGDMTGGLCGMWSLSPKSSCSVCSWLKGNFRFGLASAKVEMIEVIGNRLI